MATSSQAPGPGKAVFGPFEFVSSSLDLRKHGTSVRLRGQPAHILAALLARPGAVVTREELQGLLWQGSIFVDFEQGLNTAVNKLRQTLGDSADAPRYVETLPGIGYRFIAPVHSGGSRPVLEMPLPPASSAPRVGSVRNRTRLGLAIALVMVAAAGSTIFLLTRTASPAASQSAVRFQIPVPPELSLSGSETFSLSPDGNTVVYLARTSAGGSGLWSQPLNQLSPRLIPGTEMATDSPVFWSPDSKLVAFYARETLSAVDLKSGTVREICRVPSAVLGGAWHKSGEIIFGTETNGIMRVRAEGGQAVPVTVRSPGDVVHAWPSLLPDGKHFIYSRLTTDAAAAGIFLRSLDARPGDPDLKRLVATRVSAQMLNPKGGGVLLFQRENTLWAQQFDLGRLELKGEPAIVVASVGHTRAYGFFSASENGRLVYRDSQSELGQFFWFSREGRKEAAVGAPHYLDGVPALSPDDSRFAISKFDGHSSIWVHDLARETEQKMTSDASLNVSPVWARDGKRLFFSSGRSGIYDLYSVGAGDSQPERREYSSGENKFPSDTTPDGRFLVYQARTAKQNSDIWLLPLSGAGKSEPVPLVKTAADEHSAVISADGNWFAFVSDETGASEVYAGPFPPAPGADQKILISRGGGTMPHWRKDGKELYFRSPQGKLMTVDIRTNAELHAGAQRELFHLSGQRWAAAADGSRFLVNDPVLKTVPPFVAVLDWAAEWRR